MAKKLNLIRASFVSKAVKNPGPTPLTVNGSEDHETVLRPEHFNMSRNTQNLRITSLENHGNLLYLNKSGAWVDVPLKKTFTYAELQAGKLKFVGDSNAYGQHYSNFEAEVLQGRLVQKIKVDINLQGVNDAAVITGQDHGSVIENQTTPLIGKLNISDVDGPEQQKFVAKTIGNSYGNFRIAEDGSWQFTLNNTSQSVKQLNTGESATTTFTVNSVDGTEKSISFTVQGVNDAPNARPEIHINPLQFNGNVEVTAGKTLNPTITAKESADISLYQANKLLINNLVLVTDQDIVRDDNALGVALVGADTTNGYFMYKTYYEDTWIRIDNVNATHALLLDRSDYICFVPNDPNFYDKAAISLCGWDKTSGTLHDYVAVNQDDPTGAFSAKTVTIGLQHSLGDDTLQTDIESFLNSNTIINLESGDDTVIFNTNSQQTPQNLVVDGEFFSRLNGVEKIIFQGDNNYTIYTQALGFAYSIDTSQISNQYTVNWNNTNTDNTRLLWITNAYQLEHHLFESQQFNGGAPTTLIKAQITPDKDTDVTKIHLSSSDAGYLTDAFNALAFLSDSQSDIATRFELTLDPNYAGHSNNAPLYAQSPLNSLFNYTESLNISGINLDSNDSLYVDARNFGNDIDVSLNRLSTPSLMSVKLTGGSGSDTFLLPDLDQYLDKSFESGRIKANVSMNVNLGEGDDNFVVSSDWYMRGANADPTAQTINFKLGFDGGAGSDTLTIAGADREIDLNTLSTFFKNIENINLNGLQTNTVDTGNGKYNLTLSLTGLDKITDANHQLFVNGDNGDTVTLTDGSQNWTQQEDQTVNDITYHVYSDNADASHQLYIQDGINITLG